MPTPEERLSDAGLKLPPTPDPVAIYVPAVVSGEYVHTSGQLPLRDGVLVTTGKVGAEISAEEAEEQARQCTLNALAAIKAAVGGLSSIALVVKVTGFVASAPGFTSQPAVLNGTSELLGTAFGDAGVHARSAVGVSALPLDAPVEVEITAALT